MKKSRLIKKHQNPSKGGIKPTPSFNTEGATVVAKPFSGDFIKNPDEYQKEWIEQHPEEYRQMLDAEIMESVKRKQYAEIPWYDKAGDWAYDRSQDLEDAAMAAAMTTGAAALIPGTQEVTVPLTAGLAGVGMGCNVYQALWDTYKGRSAWGDAIDAALFMAPVKAPVKAGKYAGKLLEYIK